jgi:hypothetical protein
LTLSLDEKLEIYQRTLERYEAEGDTERAEIQKRMIKWLKGKGE